MLDVETLTPEQVQTLQVDQALRIMAQIDVALTELNRAMYEANAEYYEAKRKLDDLKNTKSLLVERARNLKEIVKNS
jgi:hypothetical protein